MNCPICQKKRIKFLRKFNNYLPVETKTFSISTKLSKCFDCNFHFNSFRNDSFFKNYYKFESLRSHKVFKHFNFDDYKKFINIKDKSDILEIGGADNYLQKNYCSKNKIKIYNLDINPKSKSKLPKNKKFSRLLHIHVLEHVVNLHAHLSQIEKLMKVGGEIVVEVPNILLYHTNLFLYTTTHINHFSCEDLVYLFSKHNFEYIKSKLKPTRKFGQVLKFKYLGNANTTNVVLKNNKKKTDIIIKKSIKLINEFEKSIVKVIDNHNSKSNKIVLYGCSEFLTPILKKFKSNYLNSRTLIVDINDNKKSSLKFLKLNVISPALLKNYSFRNVYVMTPRKKVAKMVEQNLLKLNFKKNSFKIHSIGTGKNW